MISFHYTALYNSQSWFAIRWLNRHSELCDEARAQHWMRENGSLGWEEAML